MRRTTAATHQTLGLPRGWIITGAALASWMVVAVVWTGLNQLFTFVSAAI